MSAWILVLRSLRHFWRTHLGVLLGAACATAVLVGALAVGDSVRASLRQHALDRIGGADAALQVRERYFLADLADRVAGGLTGLTVAPALQLQGIAVAGGGQTRTGIVDVLGVDGRFFALSPARAAGESGRAEPPAPGRTVLNERLAEQLGVGPGDSLLLRVEKPSHLPRDMVMATIDDVSFALRVEVEAVVDEADFGRFSLRASQIPPFDLFVDLAWLQDRLELPERANMLLVGGAGAAGRRDAAAVAERANQVLRDSWSLADAELRIEPLAGTGLFQLASDRVFIEAPVVEAIGHVDVPLVGVLTYFVNRIRKADRGTPYSMVAAVGPIAGSAIADPLASISAGVGAGGIVLSEWLATDLQASVGDRIELEYYVMGSDLRLHEDARSFHVHSVVPTEAPPAAPELMPAFPGLVNTENCRDWEPGIPVELDRIRDTDEEYWDEHRGTPKAYLDLAAGQALWSNRFGSLTAVRGPLASADSLGQQLLQTLDPAEVGLYFQDIRGPALAAGTSATDFGGLFLGLSFFLIGAALLLTALLFVFGVEQRAGEIGTLLALGFRPRTVRRLFLGEALLLATIGGVVGAVLGMGYTRAVLHGLGSLWRDAVGATTLTFHALPGTLVLGTAISIVTALVAIALTMRRTFDHPAVELLASRSGIPAATPAGDRAAGRVSRWLAVGASLAALGIVAFAGASPGQAAGAFFGAGALLLIGGLAGCRLLLRRVAGGRSAIGSVFSLGVRNSGRRPGRSLATIALLASGTFLVVSIQVHRLEPPGDVTDRSSGTGGFALYGRSTLPVLRDLGTAEGRDAYGLDEELRGASIVPLRVHDGDDASCLNLSVPQNPRLLGVRPALLAERGAFRFAETMAPDGSEVEDDPWLMLEADYGDGVIPAVGDQASVRWTLLKSVGDTLDYQDERGNRFAVRIVGTVANSILQGNLVVSEQRLQDRYPSESGYRAFLIDAPPSDAAAIASGLSRALEDIGLEVTPTADRLAAFNAVQNTYLLIFQALGGLGLLLGSVGLGMVVLRNALERRAELAITSAVGFPARSVRRLVWTEHGLLLGLGLLSGAVAALLAVLPAARGPAGGLSAGMGMLVAAVAVSGVLWVWLATRLATRGPLLGALRSE